MSSTEFELAVVAPQSKERLHCQRTLSHGKGGVESEVSMTNGHHQSGL